MRWQLFFFFFFPPRQSTADSVQELTDQFSVKHKHTLLISEIHTWLLPWLCESANVYPSRPLCLTKILSGTMIHFALNSQDVCVCVCVCVRVCLCVHVTACVCQSADCSKKNLCLSTPLKRNKHMKVQHNVSLDRAGAPIKRINWGFGLQSSAVPSCSTGLPLNAPRPTAHISRRKKRTAASVIV